MTPQARGTPQKRVRGSLEQESAEGVGEQVGDLLHGPPEVADETAGGGVGEELPVDVGGPLAYARDGEDYVVDDSNGGIDLEPQWWLNLRAEPRSTVEVRGRRIEVVAHLADEADRAHLWDALNAKLDTYDGYQASVSRRIAVIRLSPVTSGA